MPDTQLLSNGSLTPNRASHRLFDCFFAGLFAVLCKTQYERRTVDQSDSTVARDLWQHKPRATPSDSGRFTAIIPGNIVHRSDCVYKVTSHNKIEGKCLMTIHFDNKIGLTVLSKAIQIQHHNFLLRIKLFLAQNPILQVTDELLQILHP